MVTRLLAVLLATACIGRMEQINTDDYLYDFAGGDWKAAGVSDPVLVEDTPRFLLKLSDGNLLCFSIEGFELFTYNLITSSHLVVNSFVNITEGNSSSERFKTHTDIGIVIQTADDRVKFGTRIFRHVIHGDRKKAIMHGFGEVDIKRGRVIFTLEDSHSNIASEQSIYEEFGVVLDRPKAEVRAVSFDHKGFSVFVENFEGLADTETHGLLGQFLSPSVRIDTSSHELLRPQAPPLPVKEGAVWAGLMGGVSDDTCWYPQGNVLEGNAYDYIVESVLATSYKHSQFKDLSKSL